MTEPDEEMESNILAAGGVLMALDQGGMEAVPMTVDGVMTNKPDTPSSASHVIDGYTTGCRSRGRLEKCNDWKSVQERTG
jgi:hypothetical protein